MCWQTSLRPLSSFLIVLMTGLTGPGHCPPACLEMCVSSTHAETRCPTPGVCLVRPTPGCLTFTSHLRRRQCWVLAFGYHAESRNLINSPCEVIVLPLSPGCLTFTFHLEPAPGRASEMEAYDYVAPPFAGLLTRVPSSSSTGVGVLLCSCYTLAVVRYGSLRLCGAC